MAETIKEMRARHESEIIQLQDACPHVETRWMPYMYAPGHYGGMVLVCLACDKVIDKEIPPYNRGV
jgi:hypothetical protein